MTMTQEQIIERARVRAVAEGVQVWSLGDGTYVSPSKSELGLAYRIEPDEDGQLACNCPGFEYRHSCKHVAAAEVLMDAETRTA